MRTTLAIVVLLSVGGLGLALGRLYLQRRHVPMMIGAHILLGFACFESMLVLIQGAGQGAARLGGQVALGMIAVAMGLGLAGPVVAKDSRPKRNAMLVAHAGFGAAGVLAAVVWVAGLPAP